METVLLLLTLWSVIGLAWWHVSLTNVGRIGSPRWARLPFHLAPLVVASLLLVVLRKWADPEVRSSAGYTVLLLGPGVGWMLACARGFSLLGLSVRDDALERNNIATTIAACGGLLGAACIYAGGNIGEGPEFWHNFFCIGLAALAFFILWLAFEWMTKLSVAISVERDVAAGTRLAGWLLAVGLILGRAIAGDWHSVADTGHDFIRDGSGAVAFLLAVPVEMALRPSVRRPFPAWQTFGLIPAMVYLAGAGIWLKRVGHW